MKKNDLLDEISQRMASLLPTAEELGGDAKTKLNMALKRALADMDILSREEFDAKMIKCIDKYNPDLIVLAGFMRILTPDFVGHFQGRMLNIHPSLLPKYRGLHTHQRSIDAGDDEHGASVHFVTPELDGGPVVLQSKVPVFKQQDAQELAERVQQQERQM